MTSVLDKNMFELQPCLSAIALTGGPYANCRVTFCATCRLAEALPPLPCTQLIASICSAGLGVLVMAVIFFFLLWRLCQVVQNLLSASERLVAQVERLQKVVRYPTFEMCAYCASCSAGLRLGCSCPAMSPAGLRRSLKRMIGVACHDYLSSLCTFCKAFIRCGL